MFKKRPLIKKRTLVIVSAVAIVCIAALIVGLVFGLRSPSDSSSESNLNGKWNSTERIYTHAAVATNGYACADIGRDILLKNGSAVEAAIAALFCEGVICLQSMGVGGGFLMTIYQHKTKKAIVLNAREMAPRLANKSMFHENPNLSQKGGLAVAIPGEIKGYWEAFKRYRSGNVEWGELIQPTIDLCREGIIVSAYLERLLKVKEKDIKESPTLKEILINNKTDEVWKEGDRIKRLKLAETLEVIKNEPDALYNGSLTDGFVKDIQDLGGIITKEDMVEYRPDWVEPVTTKLKNNITMYTTPLPGSGLIVAFVLSILSGYPDITDDLASYQRTVEAFKYGYGKRTHFGDPKFVDMSEVIEQMTSASYADLVRKNISDSKTSQDPADYGAELCQPEDHGTAHISILAPNGDAVSVTSTIDLLFGAKVRSRSTGIILNDEMDDFAAPNITNGFDVPPSPNNFIEPGKRPISSMVPAIFVDSKGEVQLVTGAAGGTRITTATVLAALNVLWSNKTITEAINKPRIHHQLFPMSVEIENAIPEDIKQGLQNIGHVVVNVTTSASSVTGISRRNELLYSSFDYRRGGATAGF